MLKFPLNLSSKPFVNHRKFVLLLAGLSLLLLLVSAWNLSSYRSLRARNAVFNQKRVTSQQTLENLQKEEERYRQQLRSRSTAEFLDKVEYVNALIEQRTFSWTRLLNDLEILTPAGAYIASIRPRIVANEVVVELIANAKTSEDAIEFVKRLESSGKFFDVRPVMEDIAKSPTLVGKQIAVVTTYKKQP